MNEGSMRKELMAKLMVKLEEYDKLILREHELLKIGAPSREDHQNYFNYIWNEKPLCAEEYDFIYSQDDMLSLGRGDGHPWIAPVHRFLVAVLPNKFMNVVHNYYQVHVAPADR